MNIELENLKNNPNNIYNELYRNYFGIIKNYILKNSGSIEDAEDNFQDTLIVIIEKIKSENFHLTSTFKTFFIAVSRNLWLKKLRDNYKLIDLNSIEDSKFFQEINESLEENKTLKDKIQMLIISITDKCKGLILDIFFKDKSMELIQKEYGYSTAQSLATQKHKCMEQIRKMSKKS